MLIIVQNLPVPFDRRVWLEATSLRRAGYEVSVICPKLKGFNRSYERLRGIDVFRYPLPFEGKGLVSFVAEFTWCFLWSAWLSVRVQRRKGFDVIHACNPPDTFWLLGLAWRLTGKSFVFDQHDLCPEMYRAKYPGKSRARGGLLHRMLLWLERRSFRAARVVIAPNESHAQIARTRGGVPEDRVFVVRSGPDLDRLRVRPAEPALKAGRPHLCAYLGEMCTQDGVDRLVRAVKILCLDRSRRDVSFVFLGGGPEQRAVAQLARDLGLDAYCEFKGHVSDDELCRYLSTADLAVDPTPKSEWSDRSTMNKIMEYMFFGCPIVAFDLLEARRSAGGAAVYARGSEEELADRIESLLDDPERRRKIGALASERVRAQLMWDHSEPHLLAAYARVFAAHRKVLAENLGEVRSGAFDGLGASGE